MVHFYTFSLVLTGLIGALVTGDNFHTLHCQSCLALTALKIIYHLLIYLSSPEHGQKTRLSESASVDVNFFKI